MRTLDRVYEWDQTRSRAWFDDVGVARRRVIRGSALGRVRGFAASGNVFSRAACRR